MAERTAYALESVVRSYFHRRDDLEPVTRAELLRRVKEEAVTILDVRPVEEFASGHVHGAVNIPQDELETRLNELPAGSVIVAYCRGPYCVMSFEAVAALRARGFNAMRLEDGYPEWKAAGLPVQAASEKQAGGIKDDRRNRAT